MYPAAALAGVADAPGCAFAHLPLGGATYEEGIEFRWPWQRFKSVLADEGNWEAKRFDAPCVVAVALQGGHCVADDIGCGDEDAAAAS